MSTSGCSLRRWILWNGSGGRVAASISRERSSAADSFFTARFRRHWSDSECAASITDSTRS
jgi:hypothetical protein